MSIVHKERDYKNLAQISPSDETYKRYVEIVNSNQNPVNIGGLLSGIYYDSFHIEYTSSTVETFRFYSGGLSGTLKATIVLTYTTSSKNDLHTGVRL